MALTKTIALDLRVGDRFVAGPQGTTQRKRTVHTSVEVVAPIRLVEVEWNETNVPARFSTNNRVYVIRP